MTDMDDDGVNLVFESIEGFEVKGEAAKKSDGMLEARMAPKGAKSSSR